MTVPTERAIQVAEHEAPAVPAGVRPVTRHARRALRQSPAIIRRYRPDDRDAIREICCRTAFRNRGAAAVFRDTDLFADFFTRYYTDVEPESAWVAEQDGRVVAAVAGCVQTRRQVRAMTRRIVPSVLARLLWRASRGRYRADPQSRAFLRWLFLKSWREAPTLPAEADAAHYHCNVLPEGYGQRLYTRLGLVFLDDVKSRGVSHVAGRFFERRRAPGPHSIIEAYLRDHPDVTALVAERSSDFGRDVLGTDADLVNRLFVFRVGDLERLLEWMAERYNL